MFELQPYNPSASHHTFVYWGDASNRIVPICSFPFPPLSAQDFRMYIPVSIVVSGFCCHQKFASVQGTGRFRPRQAAAQKPFERECILRPLSFIPIISTRIAWLLCIVRRVSSQIISRFLCNCYRHLSVRKESTSSQCHHRNTRWWDECMIYYLQLSLALISERWAAMRCATECFLHFLLGAIPNYHRSGRTEVAPLPCALKEARHEIIKWARQDSWWQLNDPMQYSWVYERS